MKGLDLSLATCQDTIVVTMYDALRRHPRVPADESCILLCSGAHEQGLSARAVSVAREGMGLRVFDAEHLSIKQGDLVSVTVKVDGTARRLSGRVVWVNEAPDAKLHIGVHFGADGGDDHEAYQRWVDAGFKRLRTDSEQTGAEMAWRREVSLATLQAALDKQRRDGGELSEILEAIRVRPVD